MRNEESRILPRKDALWGRVVAVLLLDEESKGVPSSSSCPMRDAEMGVSLSSRFRAAELEGEVLAELEGEVLLGVCM